MEVSDRVSPKEPASIGDPTQPIVQASEEPEYWSPGGLALAITSIILGMLFAVAAVLLGVTGGLLGLPPLIVSVALFGVASRQIKKNRPA